MSNELQTATTTGSTVYAIIRNSAAQAWNNSTSLFETFTNADWTSYKVALTEQGSSGFFVGNFPTSITTADNFSVEFYSGSGVESDTFIAGGSLPWNGSQSVYTPTGTNLVALSYVKSYGNITVTTYDGYLTNRIAAASAEVVNYCNNNFVLSNYTEVYDGPSSNTLLLNNRPIAGVTSLTLGYNSNNPTVIPGSAVVADMANGIIMVNETSTYFPWFAYGNQNIQVVYSAGFASIPVDVQEACAKMVMNKFAIMVAGNPVTGGGADMTMISEKMTDYSYMRRSDANRSITPDIEAVLFRYKELVI